MKTIACKVNDEEWSIIKQQADNLGVTINDFLRSKLFEYNSLSESNLLSIEKIIEKIEQKVEFGKIFTISELFDKDEWMSFTNRMTVCVRFKKLSLISDNIVSDICERYVYDDTSKRMIYRRKPTNGN